MTVLRRWAPRASHVELEVGRERVGMRRQDGGWWEADPSPLADGTDYGFILDGDGPLPDPRSPWQPYGVHGRSRWVDHDLFRWNDGGWQPPPLASGVIYELHVGTFSEEGTFDGVLGHLDHLIDLGVTHLELMPIAEFPGVRGWGYDGVDLWAPHHAYGGPSGLKRLIDACHGRGLAVLLDVVYNHLGPDGNYLARFGPYFTSRYSTPWGEAVNLDGPDSDQVRRFLVDNALMWLRDYHLDGLRLDAVHAIVDTSAVHFLEQLAGEVEAVAVELGRPLVLVAESDLNDPRIIRQPERGGYGIDAQWNEDFHHALHALLTGERQGYYQDFGGMSDLATALERAFVLDGRYSGYRRRRHGRPATGLDGNRFVAFLQNHDQIGNRARGERIGQLLDPGLCRVGAALALTAPFVPLLFEGEEWNASTPFLYFTDHQDAALAAAVRDGRRREFAAFGWRPEEVPDPQDAATFHNSVLRWDERELEPHASMLAWYRGLVRLRRELPSLTDGRLDRVRVDLDEDAGWLTVARGPVTVCCNLAGRVVEIPIGDASGRELRLASDPDVRLGPDRVLLQPHSVAILTG